MVSFVSYAKLASNCSISCHDGKTSDKFDTTALRLFNYQRAQFDAEAIGRESGVSGDGAEDEVECNAPSRL